MCLKVQKWTLTDTKVTFQPTSIRHFYSGATLFFVGCLFFCPSVCLFFSFCLSFFTFCLSVYFFLFFFFPLVSRCFIPLNRAWPWRMSDLVFVYKWFLSNSKLCRLHQPPLTIRVKINPFLAVSFPKILFPNLIPVPTNYFFWVISMEFIIIFFMVISVHHLFTHYRPSHSKRSWHR